MNILGSGDYGVNSEQTTNDRTQTMEALTFTLTRVPAQRVDMSALVCQLDAITLYDVAAQKLRTRFVYTKTGH